MHKIVCDTNALAAGSLFPSGPSGFILQQWENGKLIIITTPSILDELQRVLEENFNVSKQDADYTRHLFAYKSQYITETPSLDIIKSDATDNMFLEAASAGKADFIVSWDKHLLKFKEFNGIKIINPPDFCNILRSVQ